MKKLLLLLLCVPLIGSGQGWERIFGGIDHDWGYSVQQTTDGGYIIAGSTKSFGNGDNDVYLIKTDVNGDSLWTKTFGGANTDDGRSVQQTTDGGYILCGNTQSFGNGYDDVYLIKTDGSGIEQWTKTFGGANSDWGRSVQQTTDGGYIITGYTYSFGNGMVDVYLIKTDVNGIVQWTKTFGGTDHDEGHSVQQTTDGGYIITGRTMSFGNPQHNFYLIKTDINGDSLWTKTFGGANPAQSYCVEQTTDGGYILTGEMTLFSRDVSLIKTDVNGVEQWNKTFGGTGTDISRSVQQTTDGGYIIVGTKSSDNTYLIKTDLNGDSLWTKTFVRTNSQFAHQVQQTTDGGYIITGQTYSFGNVYNDVFLIKTDGQGNITSTFNIPMSSNRELEKVIDILGRDINPEKNKPFIEIYNDGTVEKKMIIE